MPIRSPRGRAAAYRSVWQWPLRSPARLAVTALVVLAVVAGTSYGLGAARGRGPAAPLTPLVPPPVTVSAVLPPSDLDDPEPSVLPPVPALEPTTLPLSAAPSAALAVVTRWSQAWVRPPSSVSAAQWLDGLRPYTTDEYLGVLSGVDPGNVPATRVTGAVRAVRVAPRSVQVRVPTDALTLLVTVVDTGTDAPAAPDARDGGWRVSGYDRA